MRRGDSTAQTTLDLGLNPCFAELTGDHMTIGPIPLTRKQLEKIAKEPRKVFRLDIDPPRNVTVFSETTRWVRSLCPTAAAPTVLVSGIPMHRIKDTDPIQDTKEKMRALGAPKGRVLDTATGLGYTAIEAAKNADHVVTVELDPGAIEIAKLNPWSQALFDNPKIEQIIGDIADAIQNLPAASFDSVIHDPPTLALGGDLYGESFYRQLRRVLKKEGRLFHYIGDPNSALGAKTFPGVINRLSKSGFARIERCPEAFGVRATAV